MDTVQYSAPPRGLLPRKWLPGFTLVEIMVSLSVLAILLLVSASVIGQVQDTWTASNARVSQFREARTAFDILTRNLSQATLNTYIDYDRNYLRTPGATPVGDAPTEYVRASDLQFRCGPSQVVLNDSAASGGNALLPGHAVFFQATLGVARSASLSGMDRLLCGRGYFVQYSSDDFFSPPFIPPGNLKWRYRLMEFSPPAEKNLIYSEGPDKWYAQAGAALNPQENSENISLTRPVADNILTLVVSPMNEQVEGSTVEPTAIAPNYAYNSAADGATKNLLPPLLRVVLVAIDERSAERLSGGDQSGNAPFGTELSAFQNADMLNQELENLQEVLRERRVNFRIFSTTIQIRGSKWSM